MRTSADAEMACTRKTWNEGVSPDLRRKAVLKICEVDPLETKARVSYPDKLNNQVFNGFGPFPRVLE